MDLDEFYAAADYLGIDRAIIDQLATRVRVGDERALLDLHAIRLHSIEVKRVISENQEEVKNA